MGLNLSLFICLPTSKTPILISTAALHIVNPCLGPLLSPTLNLNLSDIKCRIECRKASLRKRQRPLCLRFWRATPGSLSRLSHNITCKGISFCNCCLRFFGTFALPLQAMWDSSYALYNNWPTLAEVWLFFIGRARIKKLLLSLASNILVEIFRS